MVGSTLLRFKIETETTRECIPTAMRPHQDCDETTMRLHDEKVTIHTVMILWRLHNKTWKLAEKLSTGLISLFRKFQQFSKCQFLGLGLGLSWNSNLLLLRLSCLWRIINYLLRSRFRSASSSSILPSLFNTAAGSKSTNEKEKVRNNHKKESNVLNITK